MDGFFLNHPLMLEMSIVYLLNSIVGGRLNQPRLEINDGDHFYSKYISTFLRCPHQY